MNLPSVLPASEWLERPRPGPAEFDPNVLTTVREICRRVRDHGDEALVDFTRAFDGVDIDGRIRVAAEEFERAAAAVPPEVHAAIGHLNERLWDLHARQLPIPWSDSCDGVAFAEVVRPLASAGAYVPGGRAAYPSTVLMTTVPARVAGVERVIVCTPPRPEGSVPPAVLAAAAAAGVAAVFRVGGAQAVAAMAFGTETIPRVDKIVGPGNVWVTAAKREVSGTVGIDGLAGPTELVIVADGSADPAVLATDLVAQAEHDPQARAVLVCLHGDVASQTIKALQSEVEATPRREIVERSLSGAEILLADDEDEAAAVVDRLAPEHLQVVTANPRAFLEGVRSYGAAFLGPLTPVAFGDYGVGSNHVLPTMGTARFVSGLRAADFVTVSSVVEASQAGLHGHADEARRLAEAEGLPGHARAVEVRRTTK